MWVERRGTGPDVLLVAGLGDPAEAWQFQLDGLAERYRLVAYDNRGMGRTPLPAGPFSVATMADDAAALLRALDVPAVHVAGFPAQRPSRRNSRSGTPDSSAAWSSFSTWARTDAYYRAAVDFWRWLPEAAPTERAFLEAFYLSIYTPRAHEDGTVEKIIEGECWPSRTATWPRPSSAASTPLWPMTPPRLSHITVPTLVLAGGLDMITPPRYGRAVAMPSPVPGSRSWLKKRTSLSRRSPTCSTPPLTHSGGRSKRETAPASG